MAETKEEMVENNEVQKETTQEKQNVNDQTMHISFHDGDEFTFKSAILSGMLKDSEDEEVTTIFTGYSKLSDFLLTFNNVVIQAYAFLLENNDNDKEQVLGALRTSCNNLFDEIEKGSLDEYLETNGELR